MALAEGGLEGLDVSISAFLSDGLHRTVRLLQNAFGTLSAAVKGGKIKDVLNAALNFVRFFIGMEAVYTIPSVEKDTTFEVGFMKSALEYASALLK